MESVLNWVKGIMGCLLIMSLVLQCVPGKVYRPYLRMFFGIIFILIVLAPLSDLLDLSGTIETLSDELAFEQSAPEWEEKLLEGENWAKKQIIVKAEQMSREEEENSRQERREAEENEPETREEGADTAEAAAGIRVEVQVQEVPPVIISGEE